MNTLGLDPATRTGFCLVTDGQIIASGVWTLSGRGGEADGHRLRRLRSEIQALHAIYPLSRLAYEQAIMGTGGRKGEGGIQFTTLSFHAELRGILKLVAAELDIPCVPFAIGTIKKFATGNGRAEKHQMVTACKRQFDIDVVDDNESDAIFIALLAEQEYQTRERIRRSNASERPRKIKQPKLF